MLRVGEAALCRAQPAIRVDQLAGGGAQASPQPRAMKGALAGFLVGNRNLPAQRLSLLLQSRVLALEIGLFVAEGVEVQEGFLGVAAGEHRQA